MAGEEKIVRVDAETLKKCCDAIFVAAGMRQAEAGRVSDCLIQADLMGMNSHGVMRVPAYVRRIETGATRAVSTIEIVKESGTTTLLDGHNGMGQVIATQAMQICLDKAEKDGVAFTAVRGSNHFGMALTYSTMALPHDMIGMVFTSPAAKLMAPWGGADPILDNNPFSFAVPSGEEYPVVLDMATTVVSRGKIAVAAKKGEKIPLEWAMTADGLPTNDPQAAFNGILLPTGGYKGYGLTVIVGILSAVLSGAAILSTEVTDFYNDVKRPQNIGHLFGAIKIDRFCEPGIFKARMDEMIREIKNCRLAPGSEHIYLPGEREYVAASENQAKGIPLAVTVLADLNCLAQKYGIRPSL
ncbi:Ldh family oxidoreductase [Sporomusa sp. KB1]|jgi:LDH2 family malate/lactate/ureidoglycolate dehydrogenase|uniref:Ldh family oxidoreductase n=1 Tax=Sporomusa sp. KB1 TaxID=943346 RepID=UPI0011AA7183|nr:Ldh family oxidoreductase [Sporomusa sp. KB1]TWH47922.1 LDH2 family malate/lactate/ureidoglycolate dehydrogenase [Sporomusa sp. KB1]